jgi:cytochrome c-type biogenesis protein
MTGPLGPTLAFAVGAGVATFFAPCAFPLLPGYVGYYLREHDDPGVAGMVAPGAAAAAGAVVALGVVGAAAFLLGSAVTAYVPLFEPVAGAVLVVVGLLVVTDTAPTLRVGLPARPASAAGFFVFGAGYAVAAAGCVVPLFVGVVTQALARPPVGSAAVFAAYAGSVAVPLVGVTLLAGAGVDAWRSLGRHGGRIERLAGWVMVVAGVGQLVLSAFVLGWV